MSFDKPVGWPICVAKSNTIDAYQIIADAMFSDGIVNDGRFYVLELYTRDVGELYPDLARQVWTYFYDLIKKVYPNA